MVNINRRKIVTASMAGLLFSYSFIKIFSIASPRSDTSSLYRVYPLLNTIPHPLAGCSDIEARLVDLKARLHSVIKDRSAAGAELKKLVNEKQGQWNKALLESSISATNEEKILYINGTIYAVGLLFTAIAIPLASPIAIGAAMGAQILLGPINLIVHAIVKTGTDDALIFGYTQDRTLAISGLIGEVASSTAGKIIGRSVTALQIGLDTLNLIDSKNKISEAKAKAERARQEIAALNGLIASLGQGGSDIKWANLHKNLLEGAIAGLEKYIKATRDSNCLISGIQIGPKP